MSNDAFWTGIRGFLIDAPTLGGLRDVRDGAIIVDGDGLIVERGNYEDLLRRPRSLPVRWLHSRWMLILPGLIDIHTHIPQYPAVARGSAELLPWLKEHIFPLEREFTGAKARGEVGAYFQEVARHGTTTVMAYTAIYEDSCDAAFRAAEKTGIRAILGKVMMDTGSYGQLAPEKIMSQSLAESERLCKKWHGANNGLLEYAFSPRFALSCTPELMEEAALMAKKHGAWIQTHLSENLGELEAVRELYPKALDYTDVYDRCGMLTPKTVFGHCIHLSERERDRLAEARSIAAHCPTANLFLASGIMPLDKMQNAGVPIGLGSDVAAGPELNMWQVMRCALESQKARSFYEKDTRLPSPASVFHLATQGAADAMGKGEIIGSLDIGKDADITVVDIAAMLPYRASGRSVDDLSAEDVLNLCIHRGGPHSVVETFVRGKSVWRTVQPELF